MGKTIGQMAREYTIKRISELKMMDTLFFNGKAVGEAYRDGMRDAFALIGREIDFCTINSYKFKILHIRDFMDRMMERKE